MHINVYLVEFTNLGLTKIPCCNSMQNLEKYKTTNIGASIFVEQTYTTDK